MIQLPTQAEDSQSATQNQNQISLPKAPRGTLKLTLVDIKGTQISAMEFQMIPKLDMPPGIGIGCKILLKQGSKIARGMVLLEVNKVVVLGGKVEAMDKEWREGLEGRLKASIESEEG